MSLALESAFGGSTGSAGSDGLGRARTGSDGQAALLRVWTTGGGSPLAADWALGPAGPEPALEAELKLTDPGRFTLSGALKGVSGPAALAGLDVELLDRSGVWANPVAATASGATGKFSAAFARRLRGGCPTSRRSPP